MKILKIIFIILFILIIVLSTGLFIFIKTADIQKYKKQIIAKISSKLERDVGVGNVELNFSISKGVSLSIQDFFIGGHPDFSSSPLLTIDSIHLGLDIRKLVFEWQLLISEIEVTHPQVNIVRNKDGKINFQELFKKNPVNEESEKTPVLPQKIKKTAPEAYIPFMVQSAEATEESEHSFNMLVKAVHIVDGSVSFTDRTGAYPKILTIDKIYFQTSNLSLEKQFLFQLDCSLLSTKKNVHLEGQMKLSAKNHQVRLDNFFIRTDLSNLSTEKALEAFPSLQFLGIEKNLKGKVYLDGNKLIASKKGLLKLLLTGHLIDAEIKLASLAYPIENIDVEFTMTEANVNISEIFMYLASGKINGRLKLEDYLHKQKFSFNMDMEDIHLDELVSEEILPVKVEGKLYGKVAGEGGGLSKSQLKEAAIADVIMEVKEGKVVDVNVLRVVLNGISMVPNLVEKIERNLSDKYREDLRLKDTKLEKINIKAKLSKGILDFKKVEVGGAGFLASAKGQLDYRQNLDLEADVFIAQDLSSSMIAEVKELSGLLDDKQQIRIPLRGYHGKLKNFIMYPDLEYLGKKIIRNRGKEELKKVLFKAMDIEEAQPPAQEGESSDQQDSKPQPSRPEEILIDTIFDAIFK